MSNSKRIDKPQTTTKGSVKQTKTTTTALVKKPTTTTLKKPHTDAVFQTQLTQQQAGNKTVRRTLDLTTIAVKKAVKDDKIAVKKHAVKPSVQPVKTAQNKNTPTRKIAMTNIHNVTVASPPPKRKEEPEIIEEDIKPRTKRERTKTHTINPEDSVMKRLQQEKEKNTQAIEINLTKSPDLVPDPIAFEITFDPLEIKDNNDDYEDDFDSYESDFESEQSDEKTSTPEESGSEENEVNLNLEIPQREEEKKLDSGNYDLPPQQNRIPMENITENLENQDSGFDCQPPKSEPEFQSMEYRSNNFFEPIDSFSEIKSSKYSRSRDLMKKIFLDSMTYSLFEMKPIQYEVYMKMYGHVNTTQNFTQTRQDEANEETQTDSIDLESKWTQFPPNFSADSFGEKGSISGAYFEEKVGVGRGLITDEMSSAMQRPWNSQVLESSKLIDYDRLNLFLKSCATSLAGIINQISVLKSDISGCIGYRELNLNHAFMRGQIARKVISIPDVHNLVALITMSEHSEEILISIWSMLDVNTPQRILKSFNVIVSLTAHRMFPNLIIAGLEDGSICCWNLTESQLWDQDPKEPHYQPPSLIIPTKQSQHRLIKLCAINSEIEQSHGPAEIACLYENGTITTWIIVEQSSVGEKYKLIFNTEICSNETKAVSQVKPKTKFEKTVGYFENDLFSDDALRELQSKDEKEQRAGGSYFVCTDMDVIDGSFLVATNKNFILVVSRGNSKTVQKIFVPEASRVVSVTKILVVAKGKKVLIGLSDGSVKLQNFLSENVIQEQERGESSSFLSEKDDLETDHENITGKSCAIQNIVLNERKLYEDLQAKQNLDSLEVKSGIFRETALNEDFDCFENISYEKMMIKPSLFSRGFVKCIFVDKNRLFALDGNQLKILDINKDELSITGQVADFSLIKTGNSNQSLILVQEQTVHVHQFE